MNFAQSLRFLLLPSLKATQQEFKTWKNEKKQEGLLGRKTKLFSFFPTALFPHVHKKVLASSRRCPLTVRRRRRRRPTVTTAAHTLSGLTYLGNKTFFPVRYIQYSFFLHFSKSYETRKQFFLQGNGVRPSVIAATLDSIIATDRPPIVEGLLYLRTFLPGLGWVECPATIISQAMSEEGGKALSNRGGIKTGQAEETRKWTWL